MFMAPSIEYLGHQIDKDGLHPTEEKVTCIKQAPTPSTIMELKAFMGLLNYYGKFIPNLATVLAPLYCLLQKDTKWNWGKDQQEAFERAKDLTSLGSMNLVWGSRIVVPPKMRSCVLDELHQGIVKMKGLARGYVWWPGMDCDIEKLVKSCNICQVIRHFPPTAPLHPWEWPKQPWSRLHADFAGPFQGHMFLLVVDACSKWLDVHVMKSISSSATIKKLQSIFAIHGLPHKLVTDNVPAFISSEFKTFMDINGIVHIRSAPYHPSTNG